MKNQERTELSVPRSHPETTKKVVALGALAFAGLVIGLTILNLSPAKTLAIGLGGGFLILSIRRAEVPLYTLVFLLIMLQEENITKGSVLAYSELLSQPGIPSLPEVLVGVLTIILLTRYLLLGDDLPVSPLNTPLLIYFGLVAASLAAGLACGNETIIVKQDLKKFLLPAFFFLCAINIVNSPKKAKSLMLFVFIVTFVKACLGIISYMKGLGFEYGGSGVVFLETSDNLLMATSVVVVVSLLTFSVARKSALLYLCLATIPMLFSLVFSYRRNAWLGLLASLALLFWLTPGKRKARTVMVVLSGGLVLLSLISLSSVSKVIPSEKFLKLRFASIGDRDESSNLAHISEWEVTVQSAMKQPFFGLGLGSVHPPVPYFEGLMRHTVHNAFLMLWMKMGIFAVALLFWCLGRYLMFGVRAAKQEGDPSMRALQVGLFSTLGYWAISLNVGPTWFYYRESCLMMLVVVLVIQLFPTTDKGLQGDQVTAGAASARKASVLG